MPLSRPRPFFFMINLATGRGWPVDLSRYSPGQFDRGAGPVKEGLWLVVSLFLFRLCPFSFSALKRLVLRAFGARIGQNVTIKPQVKITFPWKLAVGDHVWLGEESSKMVPGSVPAAGLDQA